MRSRTFLHVSLGILALAAAYHLGARTASAQYGSSIAGVAAAPGHLLVLTSTGEVFSRRMVQDGVTYSAFDQEIRPVGNYWSGGPTPAQSESWGSVKAKYRGERTPVPTDR
jgi:hypothetical protein